VKRKLALLESDLQASRENQEVLDNGAQITHEMGGQFPSL
jgi:hypothetical protein